MRTKWLNFIIRLSSIIQKTKDKLVTTHGFMSIFRVLSLIGLTIVYVFISTPFTLLAKEDKETVKIRKTLSLTFLIPTTILWIVKLLLVVIFVFILGYNWFEVEFVEDVKESTVLKIYELNEKESLPAIEAVSYKISTFPNINLSVTGDDTASNYDQILVVLSSVNDKYVRYYIEDVDQGSWRLDKVYGVNEVPEGEYVLEVAGINSILNNRSQFTVVDEVNFDIPLWFGILQSIDMYLNYIIIVFVGISVFLTLIII